MRASRVAVALFTIAATVGASSAATSTFFLSNRGFGEWATPGIADLAYPISETHYTLYVWAIPGEQLTTVGLDVVTSQLHQGSLHVTNVEVFNPDILVFGHPVSTRWGEETPNWTGGAFAGIHAEISIGGTGLNPEHDGAGLEYDALYDPDVGAFLFAQIDYEANYIFIAELDITVNSSKVSTYMGTPSDVDLILGGDEVWPLTGDSVGVLSSLPDASIYAAGAPPCDVPLEPVGKTRRWYKTYAGAPLVLDASRSGDFCANDDISSYMWDLDGDGAFETDAGGAAVFDVSYSYLQSLGLSVGGSPHDIALRVTDGQGLSDTFSSTLAIIPEPTAMFVLAIGACLSLCRRRK